MKFGGDRKSALHFSVIAFMYFEHGFASINGVQLPARSRITPVITAS